MKVTERFTRVGPDRINYRFTIEDPSAFSAPWSAEYPFHLTDEPIYEYACHEGNYALPGILAGAREDEKTSAARKSENTKKSENKLSAELTEPSE